MAILKTDPVQWIKRLTIPLEYRRWLALFIGLVALGLILWWQVGLEMTVTVEGWALYHRYWQGDFAAGMFERNRPGTNLAYLPGYLLTPDSFIGLNLLFILTLLAKGVVLYAILRKTGLQSALALAAGLLILVYPYDEGLFYLRLAGYQLHVLLVLCAIYFVLAWYQTPRLLTAIAAGVCQILALSMVEIGYFAFALTPLILVWLEGRFSRRVIGIILVWYAIPLVMGLNVLAGVLSGSNYQAGLISASNPQTTLSGALVELLPYVARIYIRGFYTEWATTFALLRDNPQNAVIVVGVMLLTILLMRWQAVQPDNDRRTPWTTYLLMAGFGLLFMGATFLPYLPLRWHRVLNERVFLLPTVGAVLFVLSMLALVIEYGFYKLAPVSKQYLFPILTGLLIGTGTVYALARHAHVDEVSQQQQQMLYQTGLLVPEIAANSTLVLFGSDPLLTRNTLMFGINRYQEHLIAPHYQQAVQWLYNDPDMRVRVCLLQYGGCSLRSYGAVSAGQAVPYNRMVGLYFDGEQMILLDDLPLSFDEGIYRPQQHIISDAPLPARMQTALRGVSQERLPDAPFRVSPLVVGYEGDTTPKRVIVQIEPGAAIREAGGQVTLTLSGNETSYVFNGAADVSGAGVRFEDAVLIFEPGAEAARLTLHSRPDTRPEPASFVRIQLSQPLTGEHLARATQSIDVVLLDDDLPDDNQLPYSYFDSPRTD